MSLGPRRASVTAATAAAATEAAGRGVTAGVGWLARHRTLRTLTGVSAAVGSLVADRLVAGHRHRAVITWSLAITAGIPALLAVTSRWWAAVLVIVVTSGSFAVLNVTATSLRQRTVPPELLGRVVAASRTAVLGAAALGALLGGVLATAVGIEAPFVLSGLVAVAATVAWWTAAGRRPTLRPRPRTANPRQVPGRWPPGRPRLVPVQGPPAVADESQREVRRGQRPQDVGGGVDRRRGRSRRRAQRR